MKIALLTTPYLERFYQTSIQQIGLESRVTTYVYYAYHHIVELYQQLEKEYDGFLVSGTAPMRIIEGAYLQHKPIRNIECGISNFYREITRAMFEYQDYNLQYAYFDFCDYICPDQEQELVEMLRTGSFEQFFQQHRQYMATMTPDDMHRTMEETRNKHLQRWNSGAIRYSLSRRSLIIPDLLEAGVNCRLIHCSLEDVLHSYRMLFNDIKILNLEDNKSAVISLSPLPYTEENMHLLKQSLNTFSRKNLLNMIVEEQADFLQIFSDCQTVKRMTCDFQSSTIKEFVEEHTNFKVCIGYGMGDTLQHALTHGSIAMKEAQHAPDHISYLVTERGDRICLSGEETLLTISKDISPTVLHMSQKTGFSTLTIQKIIKAREILGSSEFTSQDLSQILHITIRSANRILDNLVRSQLAVVLYHRQNGTKGRPQKVYQMQ